MTDILLKIKNSVAEKKKTAVAQSDLQKCGLRGMKEGRGGVCYGKS